jgi:hypothetical protein
MSKCTGRSFIVVGLALALGACSGYGFGPKEYAVTNDTGLGNDAGIGASNSTGAGGTTSSITEKDQKDRARGGTMSGAGGSTSASTPAPAGPGEKTDQRGNTPPGVSRDGQGPMGGAIVDPAGAVTKGK